MKKQAVTSITVRPQPGVMALECPTCQEGTLLIPVSLLTKARVESGVSEVREVHCHLHRHKATVTFQGAA